MPLAPALEKLLSAEQVPRVYLLCHVIENGIIPALQYAAETLFELLKAGRSNFLSCCRHPRKQNTCPSFHMLSAKARQQGKARYGGLEAADPQQGTE